MPKESMEIFSTNASIKLNDYKSLEVYSNGKAFKQKVRNQNKGFNEQMIEFKRAIQNGKSLIDFDSIINTSETTFKILESLKSGRIIKI